MEIHVHLSILQIDVNATLHCVVNSSELELSINGSNFAASLRAANYI